MRVAHLIQRFSNLTETFLYDQVCALQEAHRDQGVLTTERLEAAARPFSGPICVLSEGRLGRHLSGVLERGEALGLPSSSRYLLLRRQLEATLRRELPSLVHAHFGPMGVLAAPVCARLGIPLVVSFYGYDVSEIPSSYYRELWPRAARLIALSEDMRVRLGLLGAPARKVEVIRLGKRLGAFPFRTPRGPARNFVSVGRLVPKKGHSIALKALAQLAGRFPELSLQIHGDGPLRNELTNQIVRLGLKQRASLCGATPSHEIPGVLEAADAFLLASRTPASGDREGTPTAILEAQACGLPVVSTRHAGIPETIPESSWDLLAEEGEVASLVAAWERCLQLEDEELEVRARAGRALVEARHDSEREAARLSEIHAAVGGAGAPQLDRLAPRRRSPAYFGRLQLREALEELRPQLFRPAEARARAVDLGCGSQPYRALFARDSDYLGVDDSANPAADLHFDDEGRAPLPTGSVDVVISTQLLEGAPDPENYLAEATRLLRPGGYLLLAKHSGSLRLAQSRASAKLRLSVESGPFRVTQERGLFGAPARAAQLLQDASSKFLPSRLRPFYYAACQGVVATAERLTPSIEVERAPGIYLLLAERL